MSNDERRQAWRAYMTAMLSAADFHDCTMDTLADSADYLLKTEQQRFDQPDHAGDANKMVEPSIDAARDLLAVVEEAIERYGKPGGPWNVPSDPGGWMDRAQTAVAKARGTMSSMTSERSEEWGGDDDRAGHTATD